MLEEQIKRCADALEKIEKHFAKVVSFMASEKITIEGVGGIQDGTYQKTDEPQTEKPKDEAKPVPPVVKPAKELSRQEIKDRLTELGVEFNDRLGTKNLLKLLEKTEHPGKDAPVKEPEPQTSDDPFGDGAAAAPEPAKPAAKQYTVQEAIDIAKRLAAKFGPDKSVAIIQSYESKTISEIDAKGKLQEFVEKVIAKEKELEAVAAGKGA